MITEAANTLFSPEAAPLFNGGRQAPWRSRQRRAVRRRSKQRSELQRFRDEYDEIPSGRERERWHEWAYGRAAN